MEENEKQIEEFLSKLRKQSVNDEEIGNEDIGTFLKHFAVACKKCGSIRIFVSWEEGCDYGGDTGYAPGQKLFKCLDCGNAYSFWS